MQKRLHPGRHAPDLAGGRRHELRDAAARPAAARLRPRHPVGLGRDAPRPGRGDGSPRSTASSAPSTPRTCSSSTAPTPRWPSPASWVAPTSEVTGSTTNVLIEAAHFDPITVARSSRRHRLTDRGVQAVRARRRPRGLAAAAAQLAVRPAGRARRRHGRRRRHRRRPPRAGRAVRLRHHPADPLRRARLPARRGPRHAARDRVRRRRSRATATSSP